MSTTEPVLIGSLVRARAECDPERRFATADGVALTYAEAELTSNQLANALHALGLRQGDVAAYILRNSVEALQCWFGMAKSGLVQVPVNVEQRGELLVHIFNTARCAAVVVGHEFLERVLAVAGRCSDLRYVVVVGAPAGVELSRECLRYEDLLAGAAVSVPEVSVRLADPECILFTSGTTGPSKGAVRSHLAGWGYAVDMLDPLRYTAEDHHYCAFPLFHIFARYGTVFPLMLANARVLLQPRFSASGFWDTCRAEGITAFNFLGATLTMLYGQPPRDDDADNPVLKGTGSPVPVTFHRDFERRFGVRLLQGYGMTEIGLVLQTPYSGSQVGSCGKRVERFEVRVHDDSDNPLPTGELGEIVVRPCTPAAIFDGYVGNPEATLAAVRNLWFHTGDFGYTDGDGWFYFVDRKKDCIRRRGENISSWEVEQVVCTHPAVAECAAVGVPSPLSEEEVLAVVVLKDGHVLAPEDLYAHCALSLPDFALPRFIRYVPELPRTQTLRVEKYKLRQTGITSDSWAHPDPRHRAPAAEADLGAPAGTVSA